MIIKRNKKATLVSSHWFYWDSCKFGAKGHKNRREALIEEIRELYDLLEQVEQSKYEKLNIEKDEEVIEVEKIKFKYFKKGYLACMLGR